MLKVLVENIDYESHSESMWTVSVPGLNRSIVCTDLAMTNESHLELIGKECSVSLSLELAYATVIEGGVSFDVNDREENIRDGYSVSLQGKVLKILDDDELIVGSKIEISVELENSIPVKIGDFIEAKGLMRITPPEMQMN